MLDTLHLEDLDRILNELEDAAHSNGPQPQFLQAAAERLQFLFDAKGAAFFFQPYPDEWLAHLGCGEISKDSISDSLPTATESGAPAWLNKQSWLALPIRKSNWQRGAMAVEFRRRLNSVELEEAVRLCEAIAEIVAIRQYGELEQKYEQLTETFHKSLESLANSSTRQEAAYALVNDLAILTGADRVSFLKPPASIVISGIVKPENKSTAVVALATLCKQAIAQQKPIIRNGLSNEVERESLPSDREQQPSARVVTELMQNLVCIPLASSVSNRKGQQRDCSLLLEWDRYDAHLIGCGFVQRVLPGLFASWRQTDRLLAIPGYLRNLFSLQSMSWSARSGAKMLRMAALLALLLMLAWGLSNPTPLRIEAQGTLQPREQREVFAELDGVVSKVLVKDGQLVSQGEILIEMRSPQLEIDIEEVIGEMRALAKKSNGLNLAVNQLNDANSDLIKQSQLSSEIQELETRLDTLRKKEAALLKEKEKLKVFAPIDGSVASREIERYLRSRPVRRGDALIRIVGFDGPWQLELLVPDRDSGHVKRKLFGASKVAGGRVPTAADSTLDFVIASQPDSWFVAHADWMADSARNPDGEGMFIDLTASIEQDLVVDAHMGATVHAYIDCGREPFWFVWSRPLIESIQRKLWF